MRIVAAIVFKTMPTDSHQLVEEALVGLVELVERGQFDDGADLILEQRAGRMETLLGVARPRPVPMRRKSSSTVFGRISFLSAADWPTKPSRSLNSRFSSSTALSSAVAGDQLGLVSTLPRGEGDVEHAILRADPGGASSDIMGLRPSRGRARPAASRG